jgi:hypothetical protein
VKKTQPGYEEQSLAHSSAVLVSARSTRKSLVSCRLFGVIVYPSTPSGHLLSVAVEIFSVYDTRVVVVLIPVSAIVYVMV